MGFTQQRRLQSPSTGIFRHIISILRRATFQNVKTYAACIWPILPAFVSLSLLQFGLPGLCVKDQARNTQTDAHFADEAFMFSKCKSTPRCHACKPMIPNSCLQLLKQHCGSWQDIAPLTAKHLAKHLARQCAGRFIYILQKDGFDRQLQVGLTVAEKVILDKMSAEALQASINRDSIRKVCLSAPIWLSYRWP